MNALFANPWGLLGLLGLPAVLAIHFLQRRTKEIPASTLFLLEAAFQAPPAGRRWEKLVPSLPLWMQLLGVILLTLVLASPRWPWQWRSRPLAVVVDDSASMRVFREASVKKFGEMTTSLKKFGVRSEFLLLPARPDAPRIHAGDDAAEASKSLLAHEPNGGPVDPGAALRLARERVGPEGLVVYLTDTPRDNLPPDVSIVSTGKTVPNAGITGVTVTRGKDGTRWEAMLANRGTRDKETSWTLAWDDSNEVVTGKTVLPARGIATIGGLLPRGAARCELVIDADDFTPDDRFPFVKAEPRPLLVHDMLPAQLKWIGEMMGKGVPALEKALDADDADFVIVGSSDGTFPPVGDAIFFCTGEAKPEDGVLAGPPVAARHPFNEGLSWDGLAIGKQDLLPPLSDDTPLVWMNAEPVISLRNPARTDGGPPLRQLVFHFNPEHSNLRRLPAAAILLLRYSESLRATKEATAWERVDPGQMIGGLLPSGTTPLVMETLGRDGKVISVREIPSGLRAGLHAPARAGFFRVRDGDIILIEGAVAFADAREGDFSACAPVDSFDPSTIGAAKSDPADDAWWRLAVLLVLAALLVSWWWLSRPAQNSYSRVTT
ncbi:MAG: BatA domain-containing protein [Verrucomicrobiales bacterium]